MNGAALAGRRWTAAPRACRPEERFHGAVNRALLQLGHGHGRAVASSAVAREEAVTAELALLACPPLLGEAPFMDWDLKMPVSWDLADLEHDAVPAITAAAASSGIAAAAAAAAAASARGAPSEPGGVLR